jgi:hypothetical protein
MFKNVMVFRGKGWHGSPSNFRKIQASSEQNVEDILANISFSGSEYLSSIFTRNRRAGADWM